MTESDQLDAFRSDAAEDGGDAELTVRRALLLFHFDDLLLGLPAESVDAVVAWREPAPLPCSVATVAGVVQDRGRILVVLQTPLGATERPADVTPERILVCSTARGFLGIPAQATRGVSEVRLPRAPVSGQTIDSSEGALVFVEPDSLLPKVLHG